MGKTKNNLNRLNTLRTSLRISITNLAEFLGVPVERIRDIESGNKPSVAELIDIAFALRTSVRCIEGKNYFDPQIAVMDEMFFNLKETQNKERFHGFWGHIGVCPNMSSEVFWYPITSNTIKIVNESSDTRFIIVPCMNNKLLLINMNNIDKLILLDEACDPPYYCTWDRKVDNGGTPLVVYEALDDYYFYKDDDRNIPTTILSSKLINILEEYIKDNNLNEEYVNSLLYDVNVVYNNGKKETHDVDLSEYNDLTEFISSIWEFNDVPNKNNFIKYQNYNGEVVLLNLNIVSFLELPLLKIEDVICNFWEEIFEENK